jgi:hypothetical protein
MSQAGVANLSRSGAGLIQTINGDTGSITGNTVTIYANQAGNNSGASVSFTNSGTTSTLNLTDSLTNTFLGKSSGNTSLTGQNNTATGYASGNALTTANGSTAYGSDSLTTCTTSPDNCALGGGSLFALTTGSGFNTSVGTTSFNALGTGAYNTGIGAYVGLNYMGAESHNILISHRGVLGESNVMRLGTQGSGTQQVNVCYIAGIVGVTVSNPELVTINSSTGQMGVLPVGPASFTWADTSGTVTAVSFNGYFITAVCTSTLPASPNEGDTISYVVDTASTLTITGNTGQKIRLGSALSAAAGTCANNARGDAITLVYRSSGTTWFGLNAVGSWTIT